jgi:putative membrane protein
MCLHAIGAHYTYAAVPYREWLGLEIDGRNHYDRFVHFLYGLLLMPVYREIFTRMTVLTGLWSFFVPVTFVMAHSEAYEIVEWQAALRFGGDLGQAYLGTQGDIWDAQKDSFAAAIGAVMGWVLYTAALRWGRNRGNQDRAT